MSNWYAIGLIVCGAYLACGLWFLVAAANMAVGVLKAGYGALEELPILLLIFSVPAAAALFINWKTSEAPIEEQTEPEEPKS